MSEKDNNLLKSNEHKCSSCGSSESETENGYTFCTECGNVFESMCEWANDAIQELVTNKDQIFANQTTNNGIRNELINSLGITPVQRMGIETAETLAQNYSFNSDMKNYLINYYTKALNHKIFFRQSLRQKRILAAVCAYVTLLNHNESVGIHYVCSAVDCNGYQFGQIYNLFVNTFPEIKPKVKPIEELIPSVLADFHFEENDKNRLKDRVIDIISIERECWLVDGRSPIHLITAALYLGWKSLEPRNRAIVDFHDFSKRFGIPYKQTTVFRIREMNGVFIKLAQLIPTVKCRQIKVHRNNVAFFVDDIIQYPNSLIFDLRKDVYQKISQKNNHLGEESLWVKSFKKEVKSKSRSQEKQLSQNNTNKRKNIEDIEENDEDLDLSDSEISSYIRTENEVKIIKKLRKRAKKLDKN